MEQYTSGDEQATPLYGEDFCLSQSLILNTTLSDIWMPITTSNDDSNYSECPSELGNSTNSYVLDTSATKLSDVMDAKPRMYSRCEKEALGIQKVTVMEKLGVPVAYETKCQSDGFAWAPMMSKARTDETVAKSHSKRASKMRDLALERNIITNQDPNGHGILTLSEEEKHGLLQENFRIPTNLPLSKEDQANLKLVRRKIRNKLSAQQSRKRNREHLESLQLKERELRVYISNTRAEILSLEESNLRLEQELERLMSEATTNVVCNGVAQEPCWRNHGKVFNED
ncbi:hypothetical protein AB6A40_004383 [Gnathostoma spinigerum]|uniref:BZIP domain-containing protein n=1 Tax=Gnathostoma spinigerum TaxID=75299 RepID=A0ABD6EK00_9BILA